MKEAICGEEFEKTLTKVASKLRNYVVSTYGPHGRQVMLSENGRIILTKDGVTVAKAVFGETATEEAILTILKQCAEKTVRDAGDGTTTSILLLQEFIDNILYQLKVAGDKVSRMDVYNIFKEIIVDICRAVESISIDVDSKEMLHHVAFVASNGDETVAKLVTELLENVGVNGNISIKESKNRESSIKIMEGMRFNSTVLSTSFLPDGVDKIILSDCVIVVSNTKIIWGQEVMDLLSDCIKHKKSVLFVCPDMDERLLLTIALNVEKKAIQAMVLSPAYMGAEKLEIFEDVALVSATHVNSTAHLNRSTIKEWGHCGTVEVTRGQCTLIDGKTTPEAMDAAIESIKKRLQDTEDEIMINRFINRINRLTSTVGILSIGGVTPAEITERKHRAEDAVESCNSALKKGVVPGGGVALLYAGSKLKIKKNDVSFRNAVVQRMKRICEAQARELYGDGHFTCYHQTKDNRFKIKDLRSGEYVDFKEKGIVESVWTIQCALQNAFATAWLLCNSYGGLIKS
jgi:chaperonin GroEL